MPSIACNDNVGIDEQLATARVTIDLKALATNWKTLSAHAPRAKTGAAVKADAYGLGLEPVVSSLANAGCSIFFAAIPNEGVRCRRVAPDAEIFVFAGLTGENASIYLENGLTPVLNCMSDIKIWAELAKNTGPRHQCAIHIDTGMNRLGLTLEEAREFTITTDWRSSVNPVLIMSHLACADDPDHPMTEIQKVQFDAALKLFPGIRASLANSAGILLGRGLDYDVTRPGIALYGGEAISGRIGPMKNVITLEGRILQIRNAMKGQTVGYGATATLERDRVLAIVGCGYGDGVLRAASGSGVPMRERTPSTKGYIAGREISCVGRISMDLTTFDVTDVPPEDLENSQWVQFIGPKVGLDEFARSAGTIGYEVLTGLSHRAARNYQRL